MNVSRATTFALLVATIIGVGVLPAPALQTTPASGDTTVSSLEVAEDNVSVGGVEWQLGLNQTETASGSTVHVGTDVASAIDTQYQTTETKLSQHALRARLETAASDDERFVILEDASERTRTHLIDLETKEHASVQQHAEGSLSASVYVERVTQIDREARALLALIDVIDVAGSDIQAAEITRQAEELRARARVLQWPIRSQVAAAHAGEREALRVHVVTTQDGVVTTAVIDGVFVREARRYDQRPTTGTSKNLQTSLDQITDSYPVAVANMNAISVGGDPNAGVFYATIETQEATTITSFIDNRNLAIFKEVYQQSVTDVRTTTRVQTSNTDLTLSVERSLQGGPMLVSVHDLTSGDPVDGAVVTLDDSRVGVTGTDGVLWVIDPGGSFEMRAQTDTGASISITTQGPGTG